MATPEAIILTENEQLAGIKADYEQRYGFHDAENDLYKAPQSRWSHAAGAQGTRRQPQRKRHRIRKLQRGT